MRILQLKFGTGIAAVLDGGREGVDAAYANQKAYIWEVSAG
jgi:hypothetical protein